MKTILKTALILSTALLWTFSANAQTKLLPKLKKYADALPKEFDKISTERQEILKRVGNYVISKRMNHKRSVLLFICTHNSRRS